MSGFPVCINLTREHPHASRLTIWRVSCCLHWCCMVDLIYCAQPVHLRYCRCASIWPVERVRMLAKLCGVFSVNQSSCFVQIFMVPPFSIHASSLSLTFKHCTQYPRTLRSVARFHANVFSDRPPPQQPPRNPKGEGRWSRRVVSRSSPDLKSGASRPSSSIRCTGKNGGKTYCLRWRQTARCVTSDDHFSGDGSRVLTHEHRREYCRTWHGHAKDSWWTDMPSCNFLHVLLFYSFSQGQKRSRKK